MFVEYLYIYSLKFIKKKNPKRHHFKQILTEAYFYWKNPYYVNKIRHNFLLYEGFKHLYKQKKKHKLCRIYYTVSGIRNAASKVYLDIQGNY